MDELLKLLTGNLSFLTLLGMMIVGVIGMAMNLLWDSVTRKPLSSKSPIDFDPSYLLMDNLKRLVLGLLALYVSIVLSSYIFQYDVANPKIVFAVSWSLGFSWDLLLGLLKKKLPWLQGIKDANS